MARISTASAGLTSNKASSPKPKKLQKAADKSPHDPTVLGHLAEVNWKLGRNERAAMLMERALTEWQKALPADYEAEKVAELDAQLKTLKRALAQKSTPETSKPQ